MTWDEARDTIEAIVALKARVEELEAGQEPDELPQDPEPRYDLAPGVWLVQETASGRSVSQIAEIGEVADPLRLAGFMRWEMPLAHILADLRAQGLVTFPGSNALNTARAVLKALAAHEEKR